MATWETTGDAASYDNGNRWTHSNSKITKITDNKPGENAFEVGETVTITFSNGGVGRNYTFAGTITHDGKVYPVVLNSTGSTHFVVGTAADDLPAQLSPSLKAVSFTVCFFPGTLIATPDGERRIEDLVPGDPVLIEDSGSVPATWIGRVWRLLCRRMGFGRTVTVKWLGRQMVSTRFGPAERLMPVRFAIGSLGGGGGGKL